MWASLLGFVLAASPPDYGVAGAAGGGAGAMLLGAQLYRHRNGHGHVTRSEFKELEEDVKGLREQIQKLTYVTIRIDERLKRKLQ